jgi:hypothetical protein
MLDELKQLVECDDKNIAKVADEVLMLQVAFEEGQISKDEYTELLQDIQRTVECIEDGCDIQLKSNALKCISGIMQVI